MKNVSNATCRKGLLLLLAACFWRVCISAAEFGPAVTPLLEAFDRADASQQKKLAVRFFDQLNSERFFDEPYVMPQDWPADSIRAEVWYCAGQYYFVCQDYSKGITCCNKALPLLRKGGDTEKAVDCMSYLSSCYFRVSDYANAIKYGKEVLEADRKTGDKSIISSDLNNIAAIYLASRRPKEALSYITEALENSKAAGDSFKIAIQMGMASEIFHNLDDDPQALEYARRAYDIDLRQGRNGKAAIRLCQMAAPLMAMGEYDRAEDCLLRALPELKAADNRQSYSIACNQLGTIALARSDRQRAAGYFSQALPFFVGQGDYFNESKSREGLYKALEQSRPEEAQMHLERFCQLKDSLYNHEMQEAISEHDAKYRNEELRLKYEYEGRLKNTIFWISALIIILAVGIIILLLYINRQRKQKHDIIKQAEQMRINFFTNITHEFRTPLTVIQSAAQEVMQRSPEDSDIHRNASDILRHEQGLLDLINQILDIAKMTSAGGQRSDWRHDDIVGFVAMLCESHRAYAAGKGLELIYAPQQERVEMDFIPDYVRKIVQNLIANAIKFSNPGGRVLVTTRVKGQSLLIYVSDEGIGMTEQQKENVFKPFYQASNDTRNIGTGIGLSLVKLAVEGMKGKIEVHSVPDEGSVFIVLLPMRRCGEAGELLPAVDGYAETAVMNGVPTTAEPALTDDDSADSDEIRILIIEDTPEVAAYMKRQLSPGYRYYFATDGNDGFQKAERLVPDLIVTDIMMPGADGFEVCRQVRNSELLNHIPVVMVTAKATHDDRLRGLEAGADAYIEKPFHADELNVRVEKLLEQRRLLRRKYSTGMTGDEAAAASASPFVSDIDRKFLAKLTDAVMAVLGEGKTDYDALAYNMCLSRAQLNRKVKAITGCTTTDFILQIRISVAKQLLDTTDAPIWDIALQCGMDNDSYFCTLFKKSTGMTPLQYKNRPR